MCLEDIRLMRGTTARQVNVITPASAGPHLVVPRNYHRVALILNLNDGGGFSWVFRDDSNDEAFGWSFPDVADSASPGLVLDIQRHGALVYGPWYIATGGLTSRQVSYFETELVAQ